MTANTVRTRELDIARLTLRAWQLAGQGSVYQELDGPQGTQARDLLEVIVDALQNEGVMLRAFTYVELPLIAMEDEYLLGDSIYRVHGTAKYIPAGQDPSAATAELVIEPVTLEAMQSISARGAFAPPTRYAQRVVGQQVSVQFWPTPQEAGTVRFQAHQLLGDNNDANKTPDLDRGAGAYLLWELAHYIANANSMPMQRCAWLAGQAAMHKPALKLAANEKAPSTVRISHHTHWSR